MLVYQRVLWHNQQLSASFGSGLGKLQIQHRCWNDPVTVHGGPPAAVFHEAPPLPISSTSQNSCRNLPWVCQGLPRIHCIILDYSILYLLYYIISYHIILYHIILYYIYTIYCLFYYIISYHIILYYIYTIMFILYYIIYHIISYHIIYIVSTASILEANLPHTHSKAFKFA